MEKNGKQRPVWDQADFDGFYASRPLTRNREDEKRLAQIFKAAAQAPTFKKALDWAQDHGIKFFIDHGCRDVGGYYLCGTGVIALAVSRQWDVQTAIGTLTHEIRHAWQDYYDFIPTWTDSYKSTAGQVPAQSFAQYFTGLALVEADAFAHQTLAQREYFHKVVLRKDDSFKDISAELGRNFIGWYGYVTRLFYGRAASCEYGQLIGADGLARLNHPREWPAKSVTARPTSGLDPFHIDDLRRLGRSLSGKNYMNNIPRADLALNILSAEKAMSFYGAAMSGQKETVANIRKAYLRLKLGLPAPQKPT